LARRVTKADVTDLDLFSVGSQPLVRYRLAGMPWPDRDQFLVNHAGAQVRERVWSDLVDSDAALVVAGFASITKIIELVSARMVQPEPGLVRVLLGTEPFSTDRVDFRSSSAAFTADVRRYWLEERGVSLRLSAKIVQTLRALEQGWLQVRFVPGATRLHAKIYLSDSAVTVGSSNFTEAGLSMQFEANVRFEKTREPGRFSQAAKAAENYWEAGRDWADEMAALLQDLLQFVTWEEALARACADLLEGQWAASYLSGVADAATLWPSQLAGIAQAMWVVENVGSVLVADATGSGKTRMGAHLTRAVRDRLWSTGRVRGDLTVLVCPPAVEQQWLRESVACGLTIRTVSHGLLSRAATSGERVQEEEVGKAQILAIDEAHNFLSKTSNRTRQVRESMADHVLLFTATPINRGAADLLSLVDLLGADNFQDETLELLDQLSRPRQQEQLTGPQQDLLRREIQRFTVRRTKSRLNALVEENQDAYRHPTTARVCRYPSHQTVVYPTGETAADRRLAAEIREHAAALSGISLLGRALTVPATVRQDYTDDRWLQMRIGAAAGLAAHHVVAAMRSSTAALLEHLRGTESAVRALALTDLVKPQATGDIISTVADLCELGRPRIELTCELPEWLNSDEGWRAECARELDHYCAIERAVVALTETRERTKAALLIDLAGRHDRVLAFDRHPISLASIGRFLTQEIDVFTASGAAIGARKQVRDRFSAGSNQPGIALCTDAMSEGLNLQGASVIVHLDLPTTLRVAEQRVGRVDRMDSPYDVIEAWWPDDSDAFATSANELLAARNAESAALLGSNLAIPRLTSSGQSPALDPHSPDGRIDARQVAEAVETQQAQVWDGIHDALDPVRSLVTGPGALLSAEQYSAHRTSGRRVLARISPVDSTEPWAFFAARGHAHGAPRWVVLHGRSAKVVHGLDQVTRQLQERLAERPPSRAFDEECEHWLGRFLKAAADAEAELLPRRLQRALHQFHAMCRSWAVAARTRQDHDAAERWENIARLARPEEEDLVVEPHQLAERWLQLVKPHREQARRRSSRSRYSKLSDIDDLLKVEPLDLLQVESRLDGLHRLEPFEQRVSACIVGVPASSAVPRHEHN
jgi:hypothetical protein